MKNTVVLVAAVLGVISGALAENTCAYGEWSSWRIVNKAQSENCESKKAYVHTRIRQSFTKNCSSENEINFPCKYLCTCSYICSSIAIVFIFVCCS